MINREWKQVTVITFADELDEYGQKRQKGSSTRQVEMVTKIASQTDTADPRYVDVTDIGLTKDKNISVNNQVSYDGNTYNVLYIIPSSRYYQILMKRL